MATQPKKTSNAPSKTSSRGQRGGTLLGLIVGLIIGLGIALVVALSITKAGLPFINKGAQPKAVEGSGGAILVDPNKPLYGNKEAAKEAAKQAAREPVVQQENVAPATPAPTSSLPSPPPAADKPAGASEDKFIYYLQAGAFRQQADADSTRAKLAMLGVEARVTERLSDSGTLYRVRVGPFGQIETMNRTREKLSENGVDVAVVRSPK
ncbi:MAG: SPOR domain-containing protein [Burkholderiaceae bacterium]